MLDQLKTVANEQYAFMASINYKTLGGLDSAISPDSLPKNYKNAMSCSNQQEWAAAITRSISDSLI